MYLTIDQFKGDDPLPDTCLVCGRQKAKVRKARLVYTNRSFIAIAIGGAGYTTYTFHGRLPLCREHKDHFETTGKAVGLTGLIGGCGGAALGSLILIIGAMLPQSSRIVAIVPGTLLLIIALFVVPVVVTIMSSKGVRPMGPLTHGIELGGVSEDFKLDLEELEDELDADRPKGRSEEDDDDSPRRGGSPKRR